MKPSGEPADAGRRETTLATGAALLRLRVGIHGAVQGVGFRPFVYRLAGGLGLAGWVNNTSQGVVVEVEGPAARLEDFLLRIGREAPPRAAIHGMEPVFLDPVGYSGFEIRHSAEDGPTTALVLPDIATCADCRRELFDPADRRYRYPFANCTNCGPRYTIITALPYDRPHTTMRGFFMCPQCQAEYADPLDRRFHAQPNACAQCGPQLALWAADRRVLAVCDEALCQTAAALRDGAVVAVKGLGGFHLMVVARSSEAVTRLRQAKDREEKPFALMYPSLAQVEGHCRVTSMEARLLEAPEAPIVLLARRHATDDVAQEVAPGNPCLGVMLPSTPLHHLLLAELGVPVVATSGNLADEPICTDEQEACRRLGRVADLFLVHDRPIRRHADDSIVRLVAGRELVLRRARGYAPLPIYLGEPSPTVAAVGGHLKNAVAVSVGRAAFLSQHIGDLETTLALDAFRQVLADLQQLYGARPVAIACDLHPDYRSSRHARQAGLPVVEVQHHYAHVLSCMAENQVEAPVLGVSWDGTGYGLDSTVWGGEFLTIEPQSFARAAHLRTFPLPGGEQAVREPRRAALGLLHEMLGDQLWACQAGVLRAFAAPELAVLRQMLHRGINLLTTSSAGRLFDAVAALVGLRSRTRFEGQAAMELEFAVEAGVEEAYPFRLSEPENAARVVDWEPMLRGILDDLAVGTSAGRVAARFHNTLGEMIAAVAQRIGRERVVLSGGCFQNNYLTERTVQRLRVAGFRPYWHQRVPPNDGGLALGQIAAASRSFAMEVSDVPGSPR